jgi:hypothetical protein
MKASERYLKGLIILSVITVSLIVFSGTAVAYEPDTKTLDEVRGTAVYEGQELSVNISRFNATAGESIYLIKITDDDTTSIANTYTHGGSNIIEPVDTAGLEGGMSYGFATSSTASADGVAGEFSLLDSELGGTWSAQQANSRSSEVELEITSERIPNYPVTISADGVTYQELRALFDGKATVTEDRTDIPIDELGYDPDSTSVTKIIDDDYITLTNWDTADGNIVANFSALAEQEGLPATGEYTFELIAADTGVSDSATIDITTASASASFDKILWEPTAGDLFNFTLSLSNTDRTFVQIGGPDSGFIDVLYIKRDNPDKDISVTVNTRLVGTNPNLDGSDVYATTNTDRFVSAYHDSGTQPFDGSPTIDATDVFVAESPPPGTDALDYRAYLSASGLITDGGRPDLLDRPLQPTQYRLYVAGIRGVNDDTEGIFTTANAQPTDELAKSVINLKSPEPKDVTVYHASMARANAAGSIDEVLSEATETKTLAKGDRLIVEMQATGLYGGLIAGAETNRAADIDFDRSGKVDTEIIRQYRAAVDGLKIQIAGSSSVGNQEPPKMKLNATDDAVATFIDPTTNKVVFVMDTSQSEVFGGADVDNFNPYTASIVYSGKKADNRYRFAEGDPREGAFSTAAGAKNHPYMKLDNEVSASQKFRIKPPKVNFHNISRRGITIPIRDRATISGETDIAPGSSVSLIVFNDNNSDYLRQVPQVSISDRGEFTANVDFSDRTSGENFTVRFEYRGEVIETADAVATLSTDVSQSGSTAGKNDSITSDGRSKTTETSTTNKKPTKGETNASDLLNKSTKNNTNDQTTDGLTGFGPIISLFSLALYLSVANRTN